MYKNADDTPASRRDDMPLSFQSENHGNIAFGFFNIESDMLLLENIFFFADDFCDWITQMAQEKEIFKFEHPAFIIENPQDIGDLMGAIHGVHFSGFIGDVYKLFPFPQDPAGFKQNPEGYRTREQITATIHPRAVQAQITLEYNENGKVTVGGFEFSKLNFHELIRYVWRGGYPRFKDEIRPDYIIKMKQELLNCSNPLFDGVF